MTFNSKGIFSSPMHSMAAALAMSAACCAHLLMHAETNSCTRVSLVVIGLAPGFRGQSWPTWGPKTLFIRENLPNSAGTSSCDPRTPLAGFYRSGRVVWGVLGRFRGGVSIYVLGGFRLVLNSNRIEIVKLGGSDRAARARGATNSHPISPSAAGCRQPKAPRRPQPAAGDLVGWQRAPCLARAGLRAPQPAWCPTD